MERALVRFPILKAMEGVLAEPVNYKMQFRRQLTLEKNKRDDEDKTPKTTAADYHIAVELVFNGEAVWVTEATLQTIEDEGRSWGRTEDVIKTGSMPSSVRKIFFDGGAQWDEEEDGEYEYDDNHEYKDYGNIHTLWRNRDIKIRCVVTEKRTEKQAQFYHGSVVDSDKKSGTLYMDHDCIIFQDEKGLSASVFQHDCYPQTHAYLSFALDDSHISFSLVDSRHDEWINLSHCEMLIMFEHNMRFI